MTKTLSASAVVAEAAHQATRHDKRECEGDLDGGNTCKFKGRDGVGRINNSSTHIDNDSRQSDIHGRDEVENPFIGRIMSLPKVC